MPRPLSPDFENAARSGALRPAILVKCAFDSGVLRLWTGIGPLVWGDDTYTGAGHFLGISEVVATQNLEAAGATLTLTGLDPALVALAFGENYQGRTVEIYLALLSDDGALLDVPDVLFSGYADVLSIAEGAETVTMSLTVENRLIDLQRARVRRYEAEDQKIFYPEDKGFDFVTSLADADVQWG